MPSIKLPPPPMPVFEAGGVGDVFGTEAGGTVWDGTAFGMD